MERNRQSMTETQNQLKQAKILVCVSVRERARAYSCAYVLPLSAFIAQIFRCVLYHYMRPVRRKGFF